MTKFIFDGYFDNIISSFGWHSINIGVTYLVNITDDVCNSKYVLEEYININPSSSLKNHDIENKFYSFDNILAQSIIYNPDKWKAVKYSFVNEVPKILTKSSSLSNTTYIAITRSYTNCGLAQILKFVSKFRRTYVKNIIRGEQLLQTNC